MPAIIRLTGRLETGALQQVFRTLSDRHESLRTTFALIGGRPVAQVAPPADLPLPVTDLSALPAAERVTRAEQLAIAEARRPFDLARGPLMRASLLRLAEQEHWFLWNIHHIVSDGYSIGLLWREMLRLYEAYATGRSSPLTEPEVQYGDFARWQQGYLRGDVLAAQLDYWKERLRGLPRLDLPLDFARPARWTGRGARFR